MHSPFLLLFQYLSIYFITFDYQIGVCTKTSSLIQPTSANLPAPPLQPIDRADVAIGAQREFRCRYGAAIRAKNPKPSLTDPNRYLYIIFRCLDTTSFYRVSILFLFFNKTLSYWVLFKKKIKNKNKMVPFYARFLDFYPKYKFILLLS